MKSVARSLRLCTHFRLPRLEGCPPEPNPFSVHSPLPLFATQQAALRAALKHFSHRERSVLLHDLGSVERACTGLPNGVTPAVRVAHVLDEGVLRTFARSGAALLAVNETEARVASGVGAREVWRMDGADLEAVEVGGFLWRIEGASRQVYEVCGKFLETSALEDVVVRSGLPRGSYLLVFRSPRTLPSESSGYWRPAWATEPFRDVRLLYVLQRAPPSALLAKVVGKRQPSLRDGVVRYYLSGAPGGREVAPRGAEAALRDEFSARGNLNNAAGGNLGNTSLFFGPDRAATGWTAVSDRLETLGVQDWVLFEDCDQKFKPEGAPIVVYYKSLQVSLALQF